MNISFKTTLIMSSIFSLSVTAKHFTHDFPVSTTIDRSNMLSETVNLTLNPSAITLMYDGEIKTFANTKVDLNIESTVYSLGSKVDVDRYELFLLGNSSSCYSSTIKNITQKVVGYEDIVKIYLDDDVSEMNVNKAYSITDSSLFVEGSNKKHKLVLRFSTLGNDVRYCDGSFVIGFRYDL
ncbi:hypothetical protein [Shewanella sp. UCD-KL12]|uniref:hypothetical protein n=1 Tax=Shewanella sp. UCD-KL12 TaxID=1917163 RepID=UPI00097148DD|nr:hypothetical protein [Shewanella sp. UCD-KL12]